jgi:hypothetical protein
MAGLVYEDRASLKSRFFCIDPASRVISTLELRPPSRALALRRGRPGCRVASSSLLSLLILVTPVLTTPRCCRMACSVHGPGACNRTATVVKKISWIYPQPCQAFSCNQGLGPRDHSAISRTSPGFTSRAALGWVERQRDSTLSTRGRREILHDFPT